MEVSERWAVILNFVEDTTTFYSCSTVSGEHGTSHCVLTPSMESMHKSKHLQSTATETSTTTLLMWNYEGMDDQESLCPVSLLNKK